VMRRVAVDAFWRWSWRAGRPEAQEVVMHLMALSALWRAQTLTPWSRHTVSL